MRRGLKRVGVGRSKLKRAEARWFCRNIMFALGGQGTGEVLVSSADSYADCCAAGYLRYGDLA